MRRQKIKEREDWRSQAEALGFNFHSMYGAAYWCESACYEFTLKQIEDDIEDPSNELEQMCFEIVDQALLTLNEANYYKTKEIEVVH